MNLVWFSDLKLLYAFAAIIGGTSNPPHARQVTGPRVPICACRRFAPCAVSAVRPLSKFTQALRALAAPVPEIRPNTAPDIKPVPPG